MLALILGAFSGILLGITGGGGSIVTIPILIYILHFSYHSGTTVSLIVVGISALLGSILKRKDIDYAIGILFVVLGVIFTPLGIKGSNLFSAHILMLSFAILMVIVGLAMLKKHKEASDSKKVNYYKIAFIAAVTGLLTGFFGVGGGFLIVPGLVLFAGLSPKKAVSTSLFIIFLISMVTLSQKIGHATIPWGITLIFLMAMLIGMACGSVISKKLQEGTVKKTFALFVLILGVIQIIINII